MEVQPAEPFVSTSINDYNKRQIINKYISKVKRFAVLFQNWRGEKEDPLARPKYMRTRGSQSHSRQQHLSIR